MPVMALIAFIFTSPRADYLFLAATLVFDPQMEFSVFFTRGCSELPVISVSQALTSKAPGDSSSTI
jgi:hypothetical protein